MLIIVNDLVAVDDLIVEKLTVETINGYIQSCDQQNLSLSLAIFKQAGNQTVIC